MPSTCHGAHGIASTATYVDGAVTYAMRSCAFLENNRYHRCSFSVPRARLADRQALLQRICDSTELAVSDAPATD